MKFKLIQSLVLLSFFYCGSAFTNPDSLFLKDHFEKIVVTGLCEPGQYFYECFEHAGLCQTRMVNLVKTCLEKHKPIESHQTRKVTAQTSIQIGHCLGQQFEARFIGDKKNQFACTTAQGWTD